MPGNETLINQYQQIHANQSYGDTSVKNLRFLRPEIKLLQPRSILDYGCGQSRLLDLLYLEDSVELHRYDPAIPEYSNMPAQTVDLLINVDVLEHVEEKDLDDVIAEMASLARNAIIIIDTKAAKMTLPDGRNAHVTIRPHEWWRECLSQHFDHLEPIGTARKTRAGFKTWHRSPVETLQYAAMRVNETGRHYGRRLVGDNAYR